MSRAPKCRACANDTKALGRRFPLPDVHRPAVMWWDKEPGWVRDEIRRARPRPARLRLAPGPWLVGPVPVADMTPKQITAELTRQSKRLAAALVGDFAGPKAAEEWTNYRREQLGLNDPNLFEECAA